MLDLTVIYQTQTSIFQVEDISGMRIAVETIQNEYLITVDLGLVSFLLFVFLSSGGVGLRLEVRLRERVGISGMKKMKR